jgi:DNA-binding transcriptional ArsR family regulator
MPTDPDTPRMDSRLSPLPGRAPLQPGRAWGERQRALLRALVDADPGIHVLRAAHVLGMNWNTCYHHVRRMAGEGTIVVAKVRGRLCLFDRKEGMVARRVVGVLLRDPRTASIARVLVSMPGLNQQDIAARVGIAPSAAYRHLCRLKASGLVDRVRSGREVLHQPTQALRDAWLALERGDGIPAVSMPPQDAGALGAGVGGSGGGGSGHGFAV